MRLKFGIFFFGYGNQTRITNSVSVFKYVKSKA